MSGGGESEKGKSHPLVEIEDEEHDEEHGDGNWLVSYADMMTLLVGFFVILLSFSKVDQDKYEELRKFASLEFGGTYVKPLGTLADRIKRELDKMGLGNQYVLKQNEEGINISLKGTIFFDTGSAELKPQAQELLNKIAVVVKTQSEDLNIIVEGHTDDVPIGPKLIYRTNWELSSIRSCRVLDIFEHHEMPKDHLTAIGFGESRPEVANLDAQGHPIQEHRDQNRRVVIRLRTFSRPVVGAGAEAKGSQTQTF